MNAMWKATAVEPALHQLLTDDVMHALLQGDGLTEDDFWSHISAGRAALHRRRAPSGKAAVQAQSPPGE